MAFAADRSSRGGTRGRDRGEAHVSGGHVDAMVGHNSSSGGRTSQLEARVILPLSSPRAATCSAPPAHPVDAAAVSVPP